MANKSKQNIENTDDAVNFTSNNSKEGIVDVTNAETEIIDLDKDIDKKINKKTNKKKSVKKAAAKKKTSKKSAVKSVKKTVSKSTKKTSKKVKTTEKAKSSRKTFSNKIEDELTKVTNIKSVEQIKKPKKIALMIGFYAVIVVAILLFCLIRFSSIKENNLLLEETVSYDYMTEETVVTTERIVEESIFDTEEETSKSETTKSETSESETKDLASALATKSIKDFKTEEIKEEEITTKQVETTEQVETTKQIETTKNQVETTKPITTKSWPVRTTIDDILPKYREIIYSYPLFNQMTLDELGVLNKKLGDAYNLVRNNVFGPEISFDDKGLNGIIYLNYTYLHEFIEEYTSSSKQNYDKLPVAPYYEYIMNDAFNYNFRTYTTNLSMRLDFKNAKNEGMYFEIPATIFEPNETKVSENGMYKTSVRVLKKAKVGFTESFSLTGLLEVLDIECNTKHNPFFDIEEIIGQNPKVLNDMKAEGYDISSMVYEDAFNYVMFDKKGYISALYKLKS